MREDVKANEPGTKQYQVTQDGKDENVFVVWEEYTGEEAVDGGSSFPWPSARLCIEGRLIG